MTTTTHSPDWKVTPAHRLLVIVGWTLALLAFGISVTAVVLDLPRLWGAVVALSVLAMGLGLYLPEPVPSDMLTGSATKVVSRDL